MCGIEFPNTHSSTAFLTTDISHPSGSCIGLECLPFEGLLPYVYMYITGMYANYNQSNGTVQLAMQNKEN
jgi:hypothetical protein